jgi:glycosyltransferase involved in cell wall biosynthesis
MAETPPAAPVGPSGSDLSGVTVLQVLPALETGGVERGTLEMAQAIARAGGTALVASAPGRLVPALTRTGGEHIALPLETKNPLGILRNAERLAELIRARRVDIVHARSRAPAWSALLACRRTGAHFMTTWHGVYGEDLPFKRRYNAVMGKGERVIAISRFIAEHLTSRYRVDPSRVRVIPRGVDPELFDPSRITADRMERLARQWRLPDGAPVVMLPGRLSRWKGQEILVRALARLARRDAVAVLVGADQGRRHYAEGLLRLAASLGLRERLFLAGQCDDMPAALMLADVVVHASVTPEAFGRVVTEAQAMCRLVIATDQGGPAETVEHGVTGWRVKPGDPAALAHVLDGALALSPAERVRIGDAARAAVLQNYTTRAMQDATLRVYRELLG